MSPDLVETIRRRLEADEVGHRVSELIEASLNGVHALESAVDGEPLPVNSTVSDADDVVTDVLLDRITVSGFRGVGSTSMLSIPSGAGLTLVVGRNGSGKSSFSEALEVVLTGESWRWRDRSRVWRDGWRNLHQGYPAEIQIAFAAAGHGGGITVERRWDDDAAGVEDATTRVQPYGRKRMEALGGLGWPTPLNLYRPLLSHEELASMIPGKPTALFDALSVILGLDLLTEGAKLLADQRRRLENHEKTAKKELPDLIGQLQDVADDRAGRSLAAVSSSPWDLATLDDVVGGTGEAQDRSISTLRRLAEIPCPSPDELQRRSASLREATESHMRIAQSPAATARGLLDLLEKAMEHHEHAGDEPCPVCGEGSLDQDWKKATIETVKRLRMDAAAYDSVTSDLRTAMNSCLDLFTPAPQELDQGSALGIDTETLTRAWDQWYTTDQDPTTLLDHMERTYPPLHAAHQELAKQAREKLDARHAAWQPVAANIRSWLDSARSAELARDLVEDLKQARVWLMSTTAELRGERFEPISQQAQQYWSQLRHESNVDIRGIMLGGSGTSRHVELNATVDGEPAAALGVMSQGELNCLAISLFLPRATHTDSPFRFVVIDDPVQAMDPARVDGLAHVLGEVGKTHQIIVFTHDDRLPESTRRLRIPATVLEITRGIRSVVHVRETLDPVQQYFMDARVLVKDEKLAGDIARRVVAGLCRSGLEAACAAVVRRRNIGRGEKHDHVEVQLEQAARLTIKASLAFFDDQQKGGKVLGYINAKWGRRMGDVFQDCNRGSHKAFTGDLHDFIGEAQSLAERINGS